MSTTVVSQARHLPACHEMRVIIIVVIVIIIMIVNITTIIMQINSMHNDDTSGLKQLILIMNYS